jgi:hypothetical protein
MDSTSESVFYEVPRAAVLFSHTQTNVTLLFERPVIPENDQQDIFSGFVGKIQIVETGEQFSVQLNGYTVRLTQSCWRLRKFEPEQTKRSFGNNSLRSSVST